MKKYILFILLFLNFFFAKSQSDFEIPDTVCVGEKLEITYLGNGGESFCLVPDANYFSFDMEVESIDAFPDTLPPIYPHVAKDVDNYFVFSTTFLVNELVRLDFGNSLSNNPTATVIYLDSVPGGMEGIQILNDNGNWYGFITGGYIGVWGEEYLIRLDFGNSLSNIPTVHHLGNIGNLSFPHELFITKENEEWIGFTTNKFSFSITRFSFGNSLANIPIGTNLGNLGTLNNPTGLFPIKENGNWYFFIANENNTISRIDFGNSLFNTPTGINFGNLEFFNNPRDISIIKVCDEFYGLLINKENENEVVLLDFSNDIESIPTTSSIGDFSEFEFPHGITTSQIVEEGLVFFVSSVDNRNFSRITLSTPLGINIDCTDSVSDLEISYPSVGTYSVQLIVDEGLPTQTSFCKDIVIIPSPDLDLGKDTTICIGETLILESDFETTLWQGEVENQVYEINESGIFTAEISLDKCTTKDSINVRFTDCEDCYIFPNAFTPDGDSVNDFFQPVVECEPELQSFHLAVFNRWGQKVFQTNNPTEGWDGKFNGKESPSDVYVWKMVYSYFVSNQQFEKIATGDLTLIR